MGWNIFSMTPLFFVPIRMGNISSVTVRLSKLALKLPGIVPEMRVNTLNL